MVNLRFIHQYEQELIALRQQLAETQTMLQETQRRLSQQTEHRNLAVQDCQQQYSEKDELLQQHDVNGDEQTRCIVNRYRRLAGALNNATPLLQDFWFVLSIIHLPLVVNLNLVMFVGFSVYGTIDSVKSSS